MCCRSSLACANGAGCQTVAFPAISCGIYGYPEEEGAEVRSTSMIWSLFDMTETWRRGGGWVREGGWAQLPIN